MLHSPRKRRKVHATNGQPLLLPLPPPSAICISTKHFLRVTPLLPRPGPPSGRRDVGSAYHWLRDVAKPNKPARPGVEYSFPQVAYCFHA
ncbi:hypothetical protein BAUCODRAFT_125618 [Baudoinia panamericana UAMH 10762]|uniref:Uncharacterized protein n=1 Tax=Baudoinia panamericana (strain UAMH 10762) TaxID=717646 RepID=M2N138_BAUPA|nr:uncharacterized protein BAUCODRAFT_125618 [Baudoinia panamericana UAMH 10762]EMC92639.1 hypothetical protein BAUCODRAFT_125618 [Baudoinia panamericana UAMH 10762]